MFPKNDNEIAAYAILQELSRLIVVPKSPYSPENNAKQAKVEELKKVYYELIEDK